MPTGPCTWPSWSGCGFVPAPEPNVERRTKEGLSKPEIIRCIKRYLAREVYHALVADFEALHAT
jgi:transposase